MDAGAIPKYTILSPHNHSTTGIAITIHFFRHKNPETPHIKVRKNQDLTEDLEVYFGKCRPSYCCIRSKYELSVIGFSYR
jgi:hypothetical protein